MSFFKHLLRGWMGGGYAGHHGKRRYGHHGGYRDDSDDYLPPQARGPVCGQCNAGNSPGARFCAQCGAALQGAPCAACGKEVPPGAQFCPNCGQAAKPAE